MTENCQRKGEQHPVRTAHEMDSPPETDSSSSATSTDKSPQWTLGFIDEVEPWQVSNRFFPSKVGGKPAWLELHNLPPVEATKCPKCDETMVFLLQAYAPSDEEVTDGFHRTIFVFVCKTETCWTPNCSKTIVVLRSQLPRINDFYSEDAPDEETCQPGIAPLVKVCALCGIRGPWNCARCQKVSYCSPGHQKLDWQNGHRKHCSQPDESLPPTNGGDIFVLPEFEITMERECNGDDGLVLSDDDDDDNDDDESTTVLPPVEPVLVTAKAPKISCNEARRRGEALQLLVQDSAVNSSALTEDDLMPFATGETDATFAKFKDCIALNPEQMLRYNRGGEPLWISAQNQLHIGAVPDCERCGARRQYEFQIMPQLLNDLECRTIDWGVIVVYSCMRHCGLNGEYAKEFCYKQDIV